MTSRTRFGFTLFLLGGVVAVFTARVPLGAAQESTQAKSPASKVPTPKTPQSNRYTITYPGTAQGDAKEGSQSLAAALEQSLSKKGYLRVQTLDTQCCALQFEIQSPAPPTDAKTSKSMAAHITVMDIDKQNLYSKDYNGSPAEIANSVLADSNFMKIMGGK